MVRTETLAALRKRDPVLGAAIDALDLDLVGLTRCRTTGTPPNLRRRHAFPPRAMADFMKILQQAQEMQGRFQQMQEELQHRA